MYLKEEEAGEGADSTFKERISPIYHLFYPLLYLILRGGGDKTMGGVQRTVKSLVKKIFINMSIETKKDNFMSTDFKFQRNFCF